MKVRVYRMLLLNGYLKKQYYLRTFLQLSHIPHYTTTLQKFAAKNKWYIIVVEDNFLLYIIITY